MSIADDYAMLRKGYTLEQMLAENRKRMLKRIRENNENEADDDDDYTITVKSDWRSKK